MNFKIVATIVVLSILAVVGYTLYAWSGGDIESVSMNKEQKLTISPQEARTSVTVDSAPLSEGGFVVIRGSDGSRIGQIIEISPYLEPGAHSNIQITLGDFYSYNESDQLVVMIYRDDGDKLFSELDEPIKGSAVFAKTGTQVPPSIFAEQIAPSDGMGMVTVRYTNTGFEPKKLTVPVGTMVEFVNQSNMEMWVASNMHPSHEILATFDQFKGVMKGQSYMYTFDKKGTWPYHDHINPAVEGVIEVE